jgi:hypothetical protein
MKKRPSPLHTTSHSPISQRMPLSPTAESLPASHRLLSPTTYRLTRSPSVLSPSFQPPYTPPPRIQAPNVLRKRSVFAWNLRGAVGREGGVLSLAIWVNGFHLDNHGWKYMAVIFAAFLNYILCIFGWPNLQACLLERQAQTQHIDAEKDFSSSQ